MHVPLNESSLTKVELQHLTYALCHYYFNWAGSIKVPAPCQYAHKIADFYVSSCLARKSKHQQGKPHNLSNQMAIVKSNCQTVTPLAKRLHFL